MASAKLLEIAKSSDPKKALQKMVGDLSSVELFSGRVLVAIYVGPEVHKSGIDDKGNPYNLYRTQAQIKEDIYQGVVGLVMKKGNLAFKDDETNKFHGQDVDIGDWVVFRPGDAKRVQINDVDCRIVEDSLIDMIIVDPTIVTHSK